MDLPMIRFGMKINDLVEIACTSFRPCIACANPDLSCKLLKSKKSW